MPLQGKNRPQINANKRKWKNNDSMEGIGFIILSYLQVFAFICG
jgi:hypothetical protein